MIIDSFQQVSAANKMPHIDPHLRAVSLLLANDPKLLNFLFNSDRTRLARPSATLKQVARAFSAGEQILVRAALDLWDESGGVQICDVIFRLDAVRLHGFLLAVESLRFSSSKHISG